MGVSTKGFVLTSVKDAMLITQLAAGALNVLIREEADLEFPGKRVFLKERQARFSSVSSVMRPESDMVQLHFTFKGESRQLTMFFRCDGDQQEFGPSSISFSMGLHGESELFVTTLAYALSMLGSAWVDRSDSDAIGPLRLTEAPLSIAGAIALKYANVLCLEHWLSTAALYAMTPPATEALIGLPLERLKDVQTLSFDELTELVRSVPLPSPGFLEDYHQRAFFTSQREAVPS